MVPHREDYVLQLKKLLDQDDAHRKLKGKQKVNEATSSQMMVQKGNPESFDEDNPRSLYRTTAISSASTAQYFLRRRKCS